MEVILKEKVDKLGDVGELVRVKDGYARNYLIPKGLVVKATPGNLKVIENLKLHIAQRKTKEASQHQLIADKLSKLKLTVPVKVGDDDRLFGSVTAITINELLVDQGFKIDRKSIYLEDPIKSLGLHNVTIKLHPDIKTELKVYVIKE
ncbi:MAG: 50S ribosomal protein L9 [Candidatus Marinimicrobia bacterium]|nr:50S ribosomal protein L9 [Candidatus Neomarinimicrobiota bacterium]|tara:strand:+ start:40348 stop:40791 length:444 start_codon:yes stop_codon:yes gene_type:complete